ncbi:biotin synthase [Methanomicrobium sp. W14]|uniref:5,10-methenyltetrahydromethanopterin hydrogenase cofactor biosynthesis protein HmdB n=1 Tax=Methanomicrobium sp. W14 TaxID=2817839 RepID=UPI001AE2A63B|nr:5,10-methenyltetrahydromethanopterin hydrogenase cofactor biosynthesis protein HmdB [Methanomicrobium sp. W14]MBP2133572.1 biotin synthase [Methanomicrobium sp. W14]
MIEDILKMAECGIRPGKSDVLRLFQPKNDDEFSKIIDTAFGIKKQYSKTVKLTSTIHITNECSITPKCKYCGFAAGTSPDGYYKPFFKTDEEILRASVKIEESGIPRVSCSGGHGFGGKQAVKAASIVKENTSLELLVNVGFDLDKNSLEELAGYGTDTVCCNLETTNEAIFSYLKPGESLRGRIDVCRKICDSGIELSSGLLIGIGESYEDRFNHLNFLGEFSGLGEIPIMGFNPYRGTPMENCPPCPLREQMLTIAVTRILFPEIRITVPTPTIGPENVRYSLMAGADNLATVIPVNYPLEVKGVGSPVCGTLDGVLKVVEEMELSPQIRFSKKSQRRIVPVGQVIRHE